MLESVQVADDYLGLDVLSSQMDVKTSNFRGMQGLPIYGMAQPSREVCINIVNVARQIKRRNFSCTQETFGRSETVLTIFIIFITPL